MVRTSPMKKTPLDPNGTDNARAFEDVRRIHLCPLLVLLKDGGETSKCADDTEEDWNELQMKVDKKDESVLKAMEKTHLENVYKDHTNKIVKRAEDLVRVMPESDFHQELGQQSTDNVQSPAQWLRNKFEDLATNQLKQQRVAKFFWLVDIYERLCMNPWVKRAYVYRQMILEEGSGESFDTHPLIKAWYIVFPMILFFFSFGFQSFMLHLATHYYIFYMDEEKGENKREKHGGELLDVFGNIVAKYFSGDTDVSDEGAVYEGKAHIPMKVLDASAAIPLFLCVVAYVLALCFKSFNIALWNKTYIVASLLAVMKGIFDVVTILPDSTGWENCTHRLTKSGLQSLRDLDFFNDFWTSLWGQLYHEIKGGGGKNGGRVRYCADMMISGHTYFACLFSMSAYKQIAYNTRVFPSRRNIHIRNAVFYICIICIFVEITLVAAARFHYTVDMLASLVLVFLLFDSRLVEQLAADWSEGYMWRGPEFVGRNSFQDWFRWCLWKAPVAHHGVIPSQGACYNHRLLAGSGTFDEFDDDLEAYTKREMKRRSTGVLPGPAE